jgi:flagellar protein FlbD
VILLTRLGGALFALNPDLIERADCTPDTVITLVNGTKYVVHESLRELAELVRTYRAGVLAASQHIDPDSVAVLAASTLAVSALPASDDAPEPDTGSVVRLHRREP